MSVSRRSVAPSATRVRRPTAENDARPAVRNDLQRKRASVFLWLLPCVWMLIGSALAPTKAFAQDEPEEPHPDEPVDPEPAPPMALAPNNASQPQNADFSGSLQIVRGPGGSANGHGPGIEIFPDAGRLWMSVRDTDPTPIERARRGGPWLCAKGACKATPGTTGQSRVGDSMLLSIKVQTPTLPLPLTIWGRKDQSGRQVLDFDPVLLGRRSYAHVCSYEPVIDDLQTTPVPLKQGAPPGPAAPPPGPTGPVAPPGVPPVASPVTPAPPGASQPSAPPGSPPGPPGAAPPAPPPIRHDPNSVEACHDLPPPPPSPDSAEIVLGMKWPEAAELADFRYLAIVDSCGNARVQPFQRTFSVPVFEVASGGCGKADGKVLRVFPTGGFLRITAFNLEAPASGDIMNVTYRVTVPALENLEESNPAKLLFPDIQLKDLRVDCGPPIRKAPTDVEGIPRPPPGSAPPPPPPGVVAPPGPKVSKQIPSSLEKTPKGLAAKVDAQAPPPPPRSERHDKPGPQSLDHGSLVISPGPFRLGNCRITLLGQTKRRLVAPLALYVSLTRTDEMLNGSPIAMLPPDRGRWIITPSDAEFTIPALRENFDGESRLKLAVFSDPLSPDGKVVLLSDAVRVSSTLRAGDAGDPERARRVIGSATIHTVPLCGEDNFETLDQAGSCLRAYLTVPAMLATLQITRAPWLEKPLVTRSVLSAVGVALAFDSYDPVERRAFPIAGQVGGFVENLGEGRVGLMGYIGVAPTLPILGSGGNTTSLGFLSGIGVNYITNENGPDEGLKPTAFLAFVVQVGQANPATSLSGKASFGRYSGE